MELETLNDVIIWSRDLHSHLGRCLQQMVNTQEDERARMLMSYLAEQEQGLADTLTKFQEQTGSDVLDTWAVEYLKKQHVTPATTCDIAYGTMSTDEIAGQIIAQHDEVIDLLRHLQEKVEGEDRKSLVDNLYQLEHQETMRITHTANRWHDL